MRRLIRHCTDLIGRMAAGTTGPVAIAVSGGSDSLALLMIADEWARQSSRELLVLTVDHGLRPEAAEEARHVVEMADALGHAAQILTWQPGKRSQAAARTARHRLLARACRQAGSGLLLLGHTRNDVEETMLMRLARPTSLAAAVGPQPVSVSPVWPEGRALLIGRPLIAVPRFTLMSLLMDRGMAWVDDPTNDAMKYERARIRRLALRVDRKRLHGVTADAMRLRAVEDLLLAHLAIGDVRIGPSALIELDIAALDAPGQVARRFLSMLLQLASGTSRPAPAQALDGLLDSIRGGGPHSRHTLGGAWLQRRDGTLQIGRDPGEADRTWRDGVWDGRYDSAACAAVPDEVPYLMRHAMPDGEGWREIISARLTHWGHALRLGAGLGAALADEEERTGIPTGAYHTPRLSPAQT